MALQKKDVPLGHYYRRIKSRLGAAQATVATAHKIAEIVYFMVLRQEEYREDVTAQNEKNAIVLKLANMEKRRKYLENKLAKIVGATISDG